MYDDKVSAALMQSLYDLWGGRPRYVPEKATDVVHQYLNVSQYRPPSDIGQSNLGQNPEPINYNIEAVD